MPSEDRSSKTGQVAYNDIARRASPLSSTASAASTDICSPAISRACWRNPARRSAGFAITVIATQGGPTSPRSRGSITTAVAVICRRQSQTDAVWRCSQPALELRQLSRGGLLVSDPATDHDRQSGDAPVATRWRLGWAGHGGSRSRSGICPSQATWRGSRCCRRDRS